MKMFVLITFCLLTLVFFSAIAGMRVAQSGMEQMKGNTLADSILHTSNGYDNKSHNINEKRQLLEKINTFNLFSFIGEELADGISNASKKVIRLVVN